MSKQEVGASEVKLTFEDGTERIIEKGCLVEITSIVDEDGEDRLDCQFHFLGGSSLAEALYVGQAFNALLRKFQK